jgi:hypothetical protein
LTSWFCADRLARKANLDVLPSEAPRLHSTLGYKTPAEFEEQDKIEDVPLTVELR